MKLIVSPEAVADIKRLYAFLADKNPAAAQHAVGVLTRAIDALGAFPERGRPSDVTNARELIVPFGQSSYLLRYALLADADEVVILRIWHGREARE